MWLHIRLGHGRPLPLLGHQIRVTRVAKWMVATGMAAHHAACFVRLRLLPTVTLTTGPCKVKVRARARGCLTGSRSAGVSGRILVEA
eukprot:3512450-Alexandrium_andersonii.AAC.1